jgi:sulfur-oxidizing protein SoxB
VGAQSPGAPIWEVIAEYLRDQKTYRLKKLETPVLKGMASNPGIGDYRGGFA